MPVISAQIFNYDNIFIQKCIFNFRVPDLEYIK